MAKILFHCTHGTESPTQADRAFILAAAAIEEGHSVSMFLAGAAVTLLQDEVLDSVLGFGENLRSYYEAIVAGGGVIYVNEFSCKQRGMSLEDLRDKKVELSNAKMLIKLSVDHDRMFTYG